MTGEDGGQPSAEATDNLADANRQLYDEQRAARNGQVLSMAGMMGMFIITILLGLLIRPFYDSNNLQAFGESGTTHRRGCRLVDTSGCRAGPGWPCRPRQSRLGRSGLKT